MLRQRVAKEQCRSGLRTAHIAHAGHICVCGFFSAAISCCSSGVPWGWHSSFGRLRGSAASRIPPTWFWCLEGTYPLSHLEGPSCQVCAVLVRFRSWLGCLVQTPPLAEMQWQALGIGSQLCPAQADTKTISGFELNGSAG